MQDILKMGLDYAPTTRLTEYANSNHLWLFGDDEELYQKNLQKPEVVNYVTAFEGKINYKLNSHGFRTKEINRDTTSIVALGCSHTFGLGLPEEDTYIAKLASMLNTSYYNLGVPGGASDTAFRIASYWLPIIKPKVVVMIVPHIARFELLEAKGGTRMFVPNEMPPPGTHRDIHRFFITNDENLVLNRQKNLLGIEAIVNRYNGTFYCYSEEIIGKECENDLARDWQHSGPKQNLKVAKLMYEDITW